jgi:hypothetical protein
MRIEIKWKKEEKKWSPNRQQPEPTDTKRKIAPLKSKNATAHARAGKIAHGRSRVVWVRKIKHIKKEKRKRRNERKKERKTHYACKLWTSFGWDTITTAVETENKRSGS